MYLCLLPSPFYLFPFPFSLLPYIIACNYLRAYKAPLHLSRNHYICRESTTNQTFFMQNEPNFPESQMNVSSTITMDYENKTLSQRGKNKANSKPNKPNFPDDQMNVSRVLSKDYENISNCALVENKANSKPIKANCRRNLEANSVFKSRKIRTTVIQPKRQISHKIAKMTIP